MSVVHCVTGPTKIWPEHEAGTGVSGVERTMSSVAWVFPAFMTTPTGPFLWWFIRHWSVPRFIRECLDSGPRSDGEDCMSQLTELLSFDPITVYIVVSVWKTHNACDAHNVDVYTAATEFSYVDTTGTSPYTLLYMSDLPLPTSLT